MEVLLSEQGSEDSRIMRHFLLLSAYAYVLETEKDLLVSAEFLSLHMSEKNVCLSCG